MWLFSSQRWLPSLPKFVKNTKPSGMDRAEQLVWEELWSGAYFCLPWFLTRIQEHTDTSFLLYSTAHFQKILASHCKVCRPYTWNYLRRMDAISLQPVRRLALSSWMSLETYLFFIYIYIFFAVCLRNERPMVTLQQNNGVHRHIEETWGMAHGRQATLLIDRTWGHEAH